MIVLLIYWLFDSFIFFRSGLNIFACTVASTSAMSGDDDDDLYYLQASITGMGKGF
jgi:hypothetical protein